MPFYALLFLVIGIPSIIGVVALLIEEHFQHKYEMTLSHVQRSAIYK